MKKQLAVLMAAATAVTTVAPAVANAATVQKTNAADMVTKAKDALSQVYTDKHDTGIVENSSATYTGDKAYLNSKYMVLLEVADATAPAGTKALKGANSQATDSVAKDLGLVVDSGDVETYVKKYVKATNNLYMVTDASKLTNYLEGKVNDSVKMHILKKGEANGRAILTVEKDKEKVYGEATSDNVVKLSTFAFDEANKLDKMIDSVKAYGANGEEVTVDNLANTTAGMVAAVKAINGNKTDGTAVVKVVVTLKSGKTLEFANGSVAYDFSKPFDSNNNDMKDPEAAFNDAKVAEAVEGFRTLKADGDNFDLLLTPVAGALTSYTLFDVDSVETIDLGTVYTYDNGYTEDGAKKVNNLRELTGKVVGGRGYINGTYNYKGVTYKLQDRKTPADIGYEITANDKGYTLAVTIPVIDTNDNHVNRTLQFKFDGLSQQDLVKVMGDLKENKEAVVGRYKRLEGTDRYQTAIEVSKEQYKDKNAKSVVIVGGSALLDGLCAAPLASAKEAPVLLAHPKTGLSADTLAEVKRATEEGGLKDKTVYIVGGTDSVPASVEKQLSDLGAVVVRVSGADRYATSKAIAERMYYDNNNLGIYYYVGGNGAADAMSIAPVASRIKKVNNNNLVSPILLVGKNGLSQETRNFLLNSAQNSEAAGRYHRGYVVGGFNSVSSEAYKVIKEAALKANASSTLERVSGDDRYATNLAVLDKFYVAGGATENVGKPTGLFVSSGSDKALVDAQVVGAFARSSSAGAETAKSTPIMLVGNKLTDAQVKYLKDNKVASATEGIQPGAVYKVGGAVASDAMKAVVDALDIR